MLLVCLTFTACSRLNLSDLVATGGATAGAALASAVGLPVGGVAAVTAVSGVSAGALVDNHTTETIGEVCSQVPDEMKADCVKDQTLLRTIKDWGMYAIYAVLAFFVITFAVGYFLPNGQHRKLRNEKMNGGSHDSSRPYRKYR